MNVQACFDNDRLRGALQHLDPELPDTQRMALLAVAARLSPKLFRALPGLSNPSRTKQALRELEEAGRIYRHRRKGWTVLSKPVADRDAVERCIERSKKVRKALHFLADPTAALRARGLEHLASALGPRLSGALDEVLRKVDNAMRWDQQVRRRRRLPVLAFVERRLPRDAAGRPVVGPAAAPADLLEITLRRLAEGVSLEARQAREKQVRKLYRALSCREEALGHWWQILAALWAEGARGTELWKGWRRRLDSWLLRRRVSVRAELRVREIAPRRLKAMYPVPDCGYGPWVEEELQLYRSFQGRYRPAFGPFTHDLWIRSHQAVAVRIRQDYGGAEPHMIGASVYTELLFETADTLSELGPELLEEAAAGRSPAAVRELRARAEAEWKEMPLRLAIAKAAREVAKPTRAKREIKWAVTLLRLAAEREAGEDVDQEMLEKQIIRSRAVGRGGKRVQPLELGVVVLRKLIIDLETRPATLAPNQPFPVSGIQRPVENALRRVIELPNVSRAEREDAVDRLETYLRRRARMRVLYSGGRMEERTVSIAARLLEDRSAEREIMGMFERARRALAA